MSSDFVSRGQALVAAGQYQEAVKVCRLGLLGKPAEVGGRVVLGQALLALRRYDEVLAEMRVALDLEASNASAFMLRGEALLRKGDAHGAAEALARAHALAPGDPQVEALSAEAERAASTVSLRRGALSFGEGGDSLTKHYPSSRAADGAESRTREVWAGEAGLDAKRPPGIGSDDPPRPAMRPAAGSPRPAAMAANPGPSLAARRDLSDTGAFDTGAFDTGTLDLEPGRDSILEVVEREASLPAAGRGSTVDVGEDDVIDVEAGDMLSPGMVGAAGLRGASVVDEFEDEQTIAEDPLGRRMLMPEDGPTVEAPLPGIPPMRPAPPRPAVPLRAPATATDENDSDDDGAPPAVWSPQGAASRAAVQARSAAPAAPILPPARGSDAPARPAPPAPRLPDAARFDDDPPLAEASPRPGFERASSPGSGARELDDPLFRAARDADMKTIRLGLGMADQTGANPSVKLPLDPPPTTAITQRPRGERTTKVRTDPGGVPTLVRPRPALYIAVWAAIGVAVIGAGIWAGFAIRDVRLSRQIATARHAAELASAADTWGGWRRALAIYADIADARGSADNRAAEARARAVLAAEFGDDIDGARDAVDAMGTSPEAAVARAFIAVADGDPAAAGKAADAARRAAPDDGAAPYLVGRAALLADGWDRAVESFRLALRADQRPLFFLGLAEAEAGRRNWPEAKAACDRALQIVPDHPGAIICRARVLSASGALAPAGAAVDADLVPALERLVAAGQKPQNPKPSPTPAVVAPAEAAMAALALAEVHRARGEIPAARQAVTRALAIGSEQRRFAEGAVALLVDLGDVAGAGKVAEAAVRRLPSSSGLHIAIAELALLDGDAPRALRALSGSMSDRPEALSVRGRARLALGELDAAAVDLDAALARAPDLEAALVARAELDLARGDARAAAARLQPRYRPEAPPRLAVGYATALREVGEREQARTVLERLLAPGATAGGAPLGNADLGRAWLELARVERDSGALRPARNAYARAIELAPAGSEARLEAALLAMDSSDPSGGREALDRLVTDRPKDGRVLVEAARAHTLLGDLDRAKQLLDRAEPEATAPRWLLARERGRWLLKKRQQKDAIQTLERATGLMPEDGDTRLLLLDAQLSTDDVAAARRVLTDIQKRFAGRAEDFLGRGRVEYYVGRNREARAAFTQARDRLVRDKAVPRRVADALGWLGRVAYEDDEKAAARALLGKAVVLDPSHADAWVYIGFTEEERRNPKAAATAFERVSQLDPENLDNWFNLGKAAFDSKQKKLAKDSLEEYLKRAPKGALVEDARKLLGRL